MENLKTGNMQHNHIIHIDSRRRIEITGVTKVITFTEDSVILSTLMGGLNIKGKNMKVNRLNVDSGDMLIEGDVDSLVYTSKDKEKKGNVLKKLFK